MNQLHVTEFEEVLDCFNNKPVKNKLYYGVEFLDTALGGIIESDLILIGAYSGVGKSEFVTTVAQNNAMSNKQVVYYALEADQNEIHNRMLYREIAHIYYNEHGKREHISYSDFILGNINQLIKTERDIAITRMVNLFNNLHIIYRTTEDITPDDIAQDMAARYSGTDLFILDHVHYVDYETDNENKGLKNLAKTLRTIALTYNTPIIAISHLRKKDRFNKSITPGLDEFHGSSDLTKIATKVITFAGYDSKDLEPHRKNTLFRIAKNRIDGSVTHYVCKLVFNIKTNSYEEKFSIGHLSECYEKYVSINNLDKIPYWAKRINNLEFEDVGLLSTDNNDKRIKRNKSQRNNYYETDND